jgi:hypothetical protein
MSREENIAAHAHCHDLLAAREFDRLGEVFAANVVDHDPSSDTAVVNRYRGTSSA